jgi:hypothetical protein
MMEAEYLIKLNDALMQESKAIAEKNYEQMLKTLQDINELLAVNNNVDNE